MQFHLRRNTALALLETGITILALLALYRLMLFHLRLSDLGVWSLVAAAASAARLGDVGVAAGINRFVALGQLHRPGDGLVRLIHTATLATAALYSLLAMLTFWPAWHLLSYAASGRELDAARTLLPYALTSLVVVSVWGVVSSSLAGLQWSYAKSGISIVGSVVLLASAALLMPSMGLQGVALAQIVQSCLLLIGGWCVLSRKLSGLGAFPTRFAWSELKPLIKYSAQIQAGTIAGFFFEPVTKMIMARFGGLDSLGTYEIASRLVTQIRNLLVSVNQTLVSAFASLNETNTQELFRLHDRAVKINALGSIALVSALCVTAPLSSLLLLGEVRHQYTLFLCILAIGWSINTVLTPIYMLGLGLGTVRYNLYSHLCIALSSPVFAILLGQMAGSTGVAVGTMAGLTCGTSILLFGYFRHFHPMRPPLNRSQDQVAPTPSRST